MCSGSHDDDDDDVFIVCSLQDSLLPVLVLSFFCLAYKMSQLVTGSPAAGGAGGAGGVRRRQLGGGSSITPVIKPLSLFVASGIALGGRTCPDRRLAHHRLSGATQTSDSSSSSFFCFWFLHRLTLLILLLSLGVSDLQESRNTNMPT